MDYIKVVPNNGKQVTAGVLRTGDMNADLSFCYIRSHQSRTATRRISQNHPAFPPRGKLAEVMSTNNKAGQKPAGNNGVPVSKVQTVTRPELQCFFRLLVCQQFGDQNLLLGIVQRKTKFEFLHQAKQEVRCVFRVLFLLQHFLCCAGRKNAFRVHKGVQQRIDSFRNPLRLQHIPEAQSRIIFVIQCDA